MRTFRPAVFAAACAACAACAAPFAAAADSPFRADLTGAVDGQKTRLTPVEGDDYIVTRTQNWLKPEDQPYAIQAFTREVAKDWKDVSFAFEAGDDGVVAVTYKAQWAEKNEDRGWVAIADIRIDGKSADNGRLNELDADGKSPKGYRLFNGARFAADGGRKPGMGALLVNHDATATARYKVEAGKTYVFTVAFKCVEPPAK